MENKKNFLKSAILICILTISMSVSVLANDETKGQCGEKAYWEYNAKKHTLYINGKGGLYHYAEEKDVIVPWEKYNHDIKKIVIAKGITKIYSSNFNFDEYEDDKIKVKVYGNTKQYEFSSLSFANKVVLYGKANNIADVVYSYNNSYVVVKKAKSNHNIVKKDGMLLSKNKKQLLYYHGKKNTVRVPDSVEIIKNSAFSWSGVEKVTLGKNVITLEAYAFCSNCIKNIVLNKKLEYIGDGCFYDADITKIQFPKNLKSIGDYCFENSKLKEAIILGKTKIGKQAFPRKAKLTYKKGIKKAYTSVAKAYYWASDGAEGSYLEDSYWGKVYKEKPAIRLYCSKVEGASGYEVSLTQDGKEIRRSQKSNKLVIKNTNLHFLAIANHEENENNPKAIHVRVRPYKKVKGKKVYGKWSKKQLVEDWSGEECLSDLL